MCERPFSDASACFPEVADRQVDPLGCGVIGWKAAPCFGCFADRPVEAFNCIRCVDDFPYGWREGKERDHLLPGPPP
jgi:hypothetical protein